MSLNLVFYDGSRKPSLAMSLLVGIGICILGVFWRFTRRRLPLPPGPKGRFPFMGMTFDMPKTSPWVTITEWANLYGPVTYARVGLTHHIYLNTPEVSREFLDKRSHNYSSRPPSVVGEIITGNMRSVLMPYGAHWRGTRKTFNALLGAKKCDTYTAIQAKEAVATLKDIFDNPEAWSEHIRRYSISVARSISYGQRVAASGDGFQRDISLLMANFSKAMTPGRYIVEALPFLRYLPSLLQPWMKELGEIRDYERTSNLNNFKNALQDAEKHPDRPCIARDIQTTIETRSDSQELQSATTCNEILGTASETMANSLLFTVMASINFPDCVRKAQEELDRVIGRSRLPTWEDEPNLPYIRAFVKEQHRWRTVAPLGFRHYCSEEDEWNGFRIPKGSIVTVNTWGMHMDPNRYPDPHKFDPARFLEHKLGAAAYANAGNVAARDHFSYGNGKRICPGIHLAERSLFIMTARMLQTFTIKPALDAFENEILVDIHACQTGLVGCPKPFRARFEYRNSEIQNMFQEEWNGVFSEKDVMDSSSVSVEGSIGHSVEH